MELEKRKVEFLYSDGTNCIFQRLDSFEQVEFPQPALVWQKRFCRPDRKFRQSSLRVSRSA